MGERKNGTLAVLKFLLNIVAGVFIGLGVLGVGWLVSNSVAMTVTMSDMKRDVNEVKETLAERNAQFLDFDGRLFTITYSLSNQQLSIHNINMRLDQLPKSFPPPEYRVEVQTRLKRIESIVISNSALLKQEQ